MTELFQEVQAWPLSVFLRRSIWVYPLVNTLHLLGIALLIGGIVALDLRLLGLWRRVPVGPLARVLVPIAAAGLVLAAPMGALLFLVRAADYAALWLFQAKMALLVFALVNAVVIVRSKGWRRLQADPDAGISPSLRIGAVASLVTWLGVLTVGRLVGYA